jgi:hypothetical protein
LVLFFFMRTGSARLIYQLHRSGLAHTGPTGWPANYQKLITDMALEILMDNPQLCGHQYLYPNGAGYSTPC